MQARNLALVLLGLLASPGSPALAQDTTAVQVEQHVNAAKKSLIALKRHSANTDDLAGQSEDQVAQLERIIAQLTRLAAQSKRTATGQARNAAAVSQTVSDLLDDLDAITKTLENADTGGDPPIIEPEPGLPGLNDPPVVIVDPPVKGGPVTVTTPFWFDSRDAVGKTAQQNKDAFMWKKRNSRDVPEKERIVRTVMNAPGAAPDMGDLAIYGQWQMCVGSSRGSGAFTGDAYQAWDQGGRVGAFVAPTAEQFPKTGDLDVARCSFQPHPTWASTPRKAGQKPFWPSRSMRWGMRRYNLGDTTTIDCDFSHIPEEHGCYDDLAGHALYRGNTFLKLGGQALQLVHRSKPYEQYKADNMPFTARPIAVLDDNHAVDCGLAAAKRSYNWTFFDYGTFEYPSTIILRNCTSVAAFDKAMRRGTNEPIDENHRDAIKSSKGFVVTQYQHSQTTPGTYAVENFVMDNCVMDFTQSQDNFGDIRGVEFGLLNHCTFINRNMRQNWVGIDSRRHGNPSGTVVIQDCVVDRTNGLGDAVVWIMDQPLMYQGKPFSLHCPGKRFVIDVATRTVREEPMVRDRILDLISPLEGRGGDSVPSGLTPQPAGHIDDMGAVTRTYRKAG